jgi:glutaredoxin 3
MAHVEIFTGPQCAYCAQAKALMDRNQIPYIEYSISNPAHMQDFARRLPRMRSIPQIFVDGKHIGNDQDLEALVAAGHFNQN